MSKTSTIVISGEKGTGRTYIAKIINKALKEAGISCDLFFNDSNDKEDFEELNSKDALDNASKAIRFGLKEIKYEIIVSKPNCSS